MPALVTVRFVPVEFLTNEQAEAYGTFTEVPTCPELERFFFLDDDVVARSAFARPGRQAPPLWVLFNRVRTGVRSAKDIRDMMREEGWNLFTVMIPVRDEIKQATAFPVERAAHSPFGELVTEMETRGLIKRA